jgi:hypothetical protein
MVVDKREHFLGRKHHQQHSLPPQQYQQYQEHKGEKMIARRNPRALPLLNLLPLLLTPLLLAPLVLLLALLLLLLLLALPLLALLLLQGR